MHYPVIRKGLVGWIVVDETHVIERGAELIDRGVDAAANMPFLMVSEAKRQAAEVAADDPRVDWQPTDYQMGDPAAQAVRPMMAERIDDATFDVHWPDGTVWPGGLPPAEPAKPLGEPATTKRRGEYPWADVTIAFVTDDTIRVKTPSSTRRLTYEAAGFVDGRGANIPDSRWEILKRTAESGTGILQEVPRARILKQAASDIRWRLKSLCPEASGDPVPYDAAQRAYKIAFRLTQGEPGDRHLFANEGETLSRR